jgi:hypothetical protein
LEQSLEWLDERLPQRRDAIFNRHGRNRDHAPRNNARAFEASEGMSQGLLRYSVKLTPQRIEAHGPTAQGRHNQDRPFVGDLVENQSDKLFRVTKGAAFILHAVSSRILARHEVPN